MKKENVETLQWLVDFANLDLENIKPGDKAKLLVEAEEHLWPAIEFKELGFARPFSSKQSLSEKMGPMAWALQMPPKEPQKYWAAILQSWKTVRQFFFQGIALEGPPDRNTGNARSVVDFGVGSMAWWATKGRGALYTTTFVPLTETHTEGLQLKILMLLEGFPAHAIRVCPGCKKLFLNPTRREKRFCGNRCMWRITTAERRGADREGYNEYQAGLMRDKYREKKGLPRKKTKARAKKKEG